MDESDLIISPPWMNCFLLNHIGQATIVKKHISSFVRFDLISKSVSMKFPFAAFGILRLRSDALQTFFFSRQYRMVCYVDSEPFWYLGQTLWSVIFVELRPSIVGRQFVPAHHRKIFILIGIFRPHMNLHHSSLLSKPVTLLSSFYWIATWYPLFAVNFPLDL